MLQYFKRYQIYVCICAVILPILYSTVYPLISGEVISTSLSSLFTAVVLFVLGLSIGGNIFERKAQKEVDELVSIYNDECNPEKFLSEGKDLSEAMKMPYNQFSAWYMSYFAQAMLDSGDTTQANSIYENITESVNLAKKPMEKLAILANVIPLAEKIGGEDIALKTIDEASKQLEECRPSFVMHYRDFLDSQKKIILARSEKDYEKIAILDKSVWENDNYPKRIRVEYAWDSASASYALHNIEDEKVALQYVVDNGGTLALVGKAKGRLNKL